MLWFSFASVVYQAYRPAHVNARVTVLRHDGFALSIEQNSWESLFALINKMYPGVEFEIPDEIDVIIYDRNFKERRDGQPSEGGRAG